MVKVTGIVMLLLLAGCAGGVSRSQMADAVCAGGEASYACQVERYNNVSGN